MSNLSFLPASEREDVSEWRGKWDAVLGESVIVGVTITQWYPHTAMTAARLAKLGLQADGEAAKKAISAVLHGGKIDLIPAKAYRPVQRIAGQIRNNLYSHSLQVLWGYLVSANAYKEWQEEHKKLENDFWGAIDKLEADWYDDLATAKSYYEAMFYDAFARLGGGIEGTADEFVESAVADIIKDVPSALEMRSKFSCTVNYSHAPMSDEIADSEEKAIVTRARIAGQIETVEGKEEARREIVEKMQREVAIQVERRRLEVERSLAQAEDAFYRNVAEIAGNLKNGLMDRNGKLHGAGARSLKLLVKQVKSLNVFDDESLGEQVASLEALAERHFDSGSLDGGDAYEALERALGGVSRYANDTLKALPQTRGVRRIADGGAVAAENNGVSRKVVDVDVAPVAAPINLTRRVQEIA